jgi:rifampin ADP-ribosylating transferase
MAQFFTTTRTITDKKFPGNPTQSYRTKDALRIVAEVIDFAEPEPALVDRIRTNTAKLRRFGIEAIDD